MSFVLILYFDWLLGPHKGQNFEEKNQKSLLRNCQVDEPCTLCFLSRSDKNSGCYGCYRLIMGKVEISYFFWTNCRYLNFVFAEIFIEYISMFHVTFFLIIYFDLLLGPHKG